VIRERINFMRKAQKQEILEFINSLHQAHEEIKEAAYQNMQNILQMLRECQEFAISLGENIEKTEGEGHITVSYVEEYCELLFRTYQEMETAGSGSAKRSTINKNKIYKALKKQLIKIENSVKSDIKVRKEIVFFPYKASMWDSMESVYLVARADPDCDAYCVAIPYYDLNPDHSFGRMHYEGHNYPKDITVIDWEKYNFEERKPDVIYTHYAYDDWNLVTSIHPRYYSSNLKKYTDCLVYIPYYSTAGGMAESQKTCPVYFNADYIVIQSPSFRDYFDERIPDKKFLPFGSPKFDKIINKCKNPPEPPKAWKEKMTRQNGERRKVYFYNTSIGGMLDDTDAFLKKLRYVFDTFKGREDACILWRPHPLLESTFDSMRAQYRHAYEGLKRYYIENAIGIYDDTPDMTDAIAWSDAYIGDSATSVTSLFGIIGKPLFILNNRLWSLPDADSWKGAVAGCPCGCLEDQWFMLTQGNKLYVSEPFKQEYHYFCNLSDYTGGGYYAGVCEIEANGKRFVCPANAQDILILGQNGIEGKIELEKRNGSNVGAFRSYAVYEEYLVLIPFRYPALVRYNTDSGEVRYFEENIAMTVADNERNEKIAGGVCLFKDKLYIASPIDSRVYQFDIESGESKIMELPQNSQKGCIGMCAYYRGVSVGTVLEDNPESIWMTPYKGQTILNWNPETGDLKEYTGFPESFRCIHPSYKTLTDEYPVYASVYTDQEIYFVPGWGNMGLKLDLQAGKLSQWDPPISLKESSEYFYTAAKYSVLNIWKGKMLAYRMLFYWPERKMYAYDLEKNECGAEIDIKFDLNELRQHEDGFNDNSQWLKYCCCENAFNSLKDFLDGRIKGRQFDREKQIQSYEEIAANNDGSCGQKVHAYVKK